ncbi:MAG: hypothetical protein D8B57_12250 [Prevotella sp.]|nr:MAG: hypothetical protein D8B57_12250 [Prevotella sp.]
MEDTYLYHLASLVLPKDVLKYFSVVKIEPSPSLLRIHLDEKMEKEHLFPTEPKYDYETIQKK